MPHILILGTNGPDRVLVTGTNSHDRIFGFGGNDTITGLLGLDEMHGGSGLDTVDYIYSDDGMRIDLLAERVTNLLDGGVEVITSFENVWGSQGGDDIRGTDGANDLEGEGGNDTLFGRDGNDTLEGEAGNDQLFGGFGSDRLIGGRGSDLFVYRTAGAATALEADRIIGFDGAGIQLAGSVEDRISLSQIDANTTLDGNQTFQFLGELTDAQGELQGPGSLWLHNDGDVTVVHGNTDTNDTLELNIRIADGTTTADDYWGGDFFL